MTDNVESGSTTKPLPSISELRMRVEYEKRGKKLQLKRRSSLFHVQVPHNIGGNSIKSIAEDEPSSDMNETNDIMDSKMLEAIAQAKERILEENAIAKLEAEKEAELKKLEEEEAEKNKEVEEVVENPHRIQIVFETAPGVPSGCKISFISNSYTPPKLETRDIDIIIRKAIDERNKKVASMMKTSSNQPDSFSKNVMRPSSDHAIDAAAKDAVSPSIAGGLMFKAGQVASQEESRRDANRPTEFHHDPVRVKITKRIYVKPEAAQLPVTESSGGVDENGENTSSVKSRKDTATHQSYLINAKIHNYKTRHAAKEAMELKNAEMKQHAANEKAQRKRERQRKTRWRTARSKVAIESSLLEETSEEQPKSEKQLSKRNRSRLQNLRRLGSGISSGCSSSRNGSSRPGTETKKSSSFAGDESYMSDSSDDGSIQIEFKTINLNHHSSEASLEIEPFAPSITLEALHRSQKRRQEILQRQEIMFVAAKRNQLKTKRMMESNKSFISKDNTDGDDDDGKKDRGESPSLNDNETVFAENRHGSSRHAPIILGHSALSSNPSLDRYIANKALFNPFKEGGFTSEGGLIEGEKGAEVMETQLNAENNEIDDVRLQYDLLSSDSPTYESCIRGDRITRVRFEDNSNYASVKTNTAEGTEIADSKINGKLDDLCCKKNSNSQAMKVVTPVATPYLQTRDTIIASNRALFRGRNIKDRNGILITGNSRQWEPLGLSALAELHPTLRIINDDRIDVNNSLKEGRHSAKAVESPHVMKSTFGPLLWSIE